MLYTRKLLEIILLISSGTSKQIQCDPKGNVRKVASNSGHVPKDRSVNDGIKESLCSLTYVGVGDAIRGIVGRGLPVALDKLKGPTTKLVFLGFHLTQW